MMSIFAELERRIGEGRKGTKMLNFTTYKLGAAALFRCGGRLVSGDSKCLRDAVLSESDVRTVVLDLAEVQSVDAAGLGVLLSLRAWAQTAGAGLKLMNLTPRVEEVLELTNLRGAFEVCSAPEMIDLLCRAVAQSRIGAGQTLDSQWYSVQNGLARCPSTTHMRDAQVSA